MKRTISIFLCLILMMSLMSVTALAAGTTVYCDAPEDWKVCYTYAWGDTVLVTDVWPGIAMTRNSNGMWQCVIPTGADKFVCHNNSGSMTGDLPLPTADKLWLVVSEDGDASMTLYEPDSDLQQDCYCVIGSADWMGNWDINSDKGKMIEVEPGVYQATFRNVAYGNYQFRIVKNHNWESSWSNYGIDYYISTASTSDVIVTFKLVDGIPDVNVEVISEDSAVIDRPLHIQVPKSWTEVNVYTWEPESYGMYPGALVQKTGDWFTTMARGDMVNLIINSGDFKTDALTIPENTELWIRVAEDRTVSITKDYPDDPVQPQSDHYCVVGSTDWMGNWDVNSNVGAMTPVKSGVYQVTFPNVPEGEYLFKVVKNNVWDYCWGDGVNNYCFYVERACDVTVTFTVNNGAIFVNGEGVLNETKYGQCTQCGGEQFEIVGRCTVDVETCTHCGAAYGAASNGGSHRFVQNVCTNCGIHRSLSYYSISPQGQVTITDCDRSTAGEMIIPDTIEGCPVTKIGDTAFSGCANLTSVVVPEGVDSMGSYAFHDCSQLKMVILPDSLRYMGHSAFENCSELVSVTLPDQLQQVPNFAFYNCHRLQSVEIGSATECIGESAFGNCRSLKEMDIPDAVRVIETQTFAGCTGLRNVQLGEGVLSVNNGAFEGCSGLVNVTIPANVSVIGAGAFHNCGSLKHILFTGSDEQWYALNIGVDNVPIHNAPVHFNCIGTEAIVVDGNVRCSICNPTSPDAGDVTGDGKVNIGDVAKAFAHVRRTNLLHDENAIVRADVNSDGKINMGDVAKIFAHVRGKKPL